MASVHPRELDQSYADSELGIDMSMPIAALERSLANWADRVTCCWICHPEQWSAYGSFLRRACHRATLVFDTVDIHSDRLRAQAELSGSLLDRRAARRALHQEKNAVAEADVTVVVTPDEEMTVRSWEPGARTELIPNLHEMPPIQEGSVGTRPATVFVGSFAHGPNVDAARVIVKEIAPLFRRRLPAAELLVVGSDPPADLVCQAEAPIRFTGWVEDLEEVYRRSRVAIAPLRFGAGLKGKVGEAMAHGVPVVTTRVGAEGFGAVEGTHLLIAETAEEFIDSIEQLYRDVEGWRRMSRAGRDLIEERFSVAKVSERVELFLNSLA